MCLKGGTNYFQRSPVMGPCVPVQLFWLTHARRGFTSRCIACMLIFVFNKAIHVRAPIASNTADRHLTTISQCHWCHALIFPLPVVSFPPLSLRPVTHTHGSQVKCHKESSFLNLKATHFHPKANSNQWNKNSQMIRYDNIVNVRTLLSPNTNGDKTDLAFFLTHKRGKYVAACNYWTQCCCCHRNR